MTGTFHNVTGFAVSFLDTCKLLSLTKRWGLAIPVKNYALISPYKAFLWKQRGTLNWYLNHAKNP
jgi:hypothetical protein